MKARKHNPVSKFLTTARNHAKGSRVRGASDVGARQQGVVDAIERIAKLKSISKADREQALADAWNIYAEIQMDADTDSLGDDLDEFLLEGDSADFAGSPRLAQAIEYGKHGIGDGHNVPGFKPTYHDGRRNHAGDVITIDPSEIEVS